MRLSLPLLAVIVALPLAAACSSSGSGGAGGATSSTGPSGPSKHVVKSTDGGVGDDAGPAEKSTGAGW
jgi:hypothetical protein